MLNYFKILGFAIPILTELCIWVDSMIYEVAAWFLEAFFEIIKVSAKTGIYSAQIEAITNRVMILSGVFALFRIAFTLVNYVIDPSKVTEATKKGTNFVKNFFIAVALLLCSNTIFGLMGNLQQVIIENQLIPKLIYGADEINNNANNFTDEGSVKKFVNTCFLLFFVDSNQHCYSSNDRHCTAYENVINGAGITSLMGFSASHFKYTPFISGIGGIFLIIYFFGYAKEMAIRLLKLLVLQVLSPIPIIMSIIPGQEGKLKKFASTYLNIWLQSIVRIITVYVAFVIVSLIMNGLNSGTLAIASNKLLFDGGVIVKFIVLLGVFHGAKELPKLIDDVLDTHLAGADSGKGFGAVLGGILGGGAGLIGGAIAGGISGGRGGGLAGAASGLFSGITGGMSSKNVGAFVKGAVGNVKGQYALGGKVAGAGGLTNFMKGGAENFFGAKNKDAATIADYDAKISDKDKLISGVNEKIAGFNTNISTMESRISDINHAQDLRGNISTALDNAFIQKQGNLEQFMANDAKLSQLENAIRHNNDNGFYIDNEDYRQIDLDRVAARRQELAAEYEKMKNEYHEAFFDSSVPISPENQEAVVALNEYNDYVSRNGMEDRQINSAERMSLSDEELRELIHNQRESIAAEKAKISDEENMIRTIENEKKAIEQEKEAFQNSEGYIRRNNREEAPKNKPWDTSNRG